jgi:hypothetical protein
VSQVAREPDVARETGSGTLAPVSAMEVFAQVTGNYRPRSHPPRVLQSQ